MLYGWCANNVAIWIINMSENKVKPIRPEEIEVNLEGIIPDYVFAAVNALLSEKYRGTGPVILKQEEIAKRAARMGSVTTDFLYDNKYMDFEPVYEKYGWKVTYDKPAYNEDYPATFTFKRKE